jgi:hypothetical protein
MGLLSDLRGSKAYLDANVFICAVEEVQEYVVAVDELLGLVEMGTITAFASELNRDQFETDSFGCRLG